MTLRSLEERVFRMDGTTPVLHGSRCPACDETYFPRRRLSAICGAAADDVDLSGTGTLYSWTYVHAPWFGKARMDVVGYGVGQVDLPEGVRVQTILAGDRDGWTIGAPMRIGYDVTESTDDGDELTVYRFAPGDGAADA